VSVDVPNASVEYAGITFETRACVLTSVDIKQSRTRETHEEVVRFLRACELLPCLQLASLVNRKHPNASGNHVASINLDGESGDVY
jgi:hypothetical protein